MDIDEIRRLTQENKDAISKDFSKSKMREYLDSRILDRAKMGQNALCIKYQEAEYEAYSGLAPFPPCIDAAITYYRNEGFLAEREPSMNRHGGFSEYLVISW